MRAALELLIMRTPARAPRRERVLAALAVAVVVGARAGPIRRVNDVHRALGTGHEEPGPTVADANADQSSPPAGKVRGDDVLRAGDPGRELRALRAHPGELLLDAVRDGLNYTLLDQEMLLLVRVPGCVTTRGAVYLSDTHSLSIISA